MSLVVNIYYSSTNGKAQKFVQEMEESGIANRIRNEQGNEKYEYFQSIKDPETVLLLDQWKNQEALDLHHVSPMMKELALLREKYDIHMRVETMTLNDNEVDRKYIRE